MYELRTESSFDSAHFLADYHGKCENLHGHRWRVEVAIAVDDLRDEGTMRDMVLDFGEFKHAVRDLVATYDHTLLVEEGTLSPDTIACLERDGFSLTVVPFRTTAENLAHRIGEQLIEQGLPVSMVEVDETPLNRAIWRP